jgi:hypothetical protein
VRRPGPGKKRSGESDRPEMVKVALLIVNLASSASKTEKISDQTGNNARAHATNARHRQTAMPMATALCRLWSGPRAPLERSYTVSRHLWAGSLSVSRSPGRARHAAHGRPTVATHLTGMVKGW